MFNWLWKLLGYHVCEEFTQWESKTAQFSRIPKDMIEKVVSGWQDRIHYTEQWQERRCTLCGMLQKRSID